MVKIMENPIKIHDFGGFPIIFGSTPKLGDFLQQQNDLQPAVDGPRHVVKQQRPEGSPFDDPGMPSSHALVPGQKRCFFFAKLLSLLAGPTRRE